MLRERESESEEGGGGRKITCNLESATYLFPWLQAASLLETESRLTAVSKEVQRIKEKFNKLVTIEQTLSEKHERVCTEIIK